MDFRLCVFLFGGMLSKLSDPLETLLISIIQQLVLLIVQKGQLE